MRKSYVRFSAFVYDLYSKCQKGEPFSAQKLAEYHGVYKGTTKVLIDYGAIMIVDNGQSKTKSYVWLGDKPNDQYITDMFKFKQAHQNAEFIKYSKQAEDFIEREIIDLQEEPRRGPGRPRTKHEADCSAEHGCHEGETRFTTILEKDLIEKVKRLAYWDRRTVKVVIAIALERMIKKYEDENGKLTEIPRR